MVQIHEVDVAIGDVLRLGRTTVTVIDIDNGEVTFRIDDHEPDGDEQMDGCLDMASNPLPR
jgi:hypothetical protein